MSKGGVSSALFAAFLANSPDLHCAQFLHAIIELGYGFESGEAEVAISGLAWCASGYYELPEPSDKLGALISIQNAGRSPVELLANLGSSKGSFFSTLDLENGSTGWVNDVEVILREHREEVLRFDVPHGSLPTSRKGALELACNLFDASLCSFYASNCQDFYCLHSV